MRDSLTVLAEEFQDHKIIVALITLFLLFILPLFLLTMFGD